ncbi:MAG: hypothetical protein HEP71_00945 [Roseivirga sp.]|nr:hypothetical protein [Roseivirga sp.]
MLISELLDGKNNPLFEQVSAQLEIKLEENPDWRAEAWDSIIRDGKAIILHCPVPSPHASLAIELLRIKAQLNGFRPVIMGRTLSPQVNEMMQTIIKSLNHHFLNQKIAEDFVELGYSAAQFQDNDGGTLYFLKDQLQREDLSPLKLSILYLSFIEPQLPISEADRQTIQSLFDRYDGGKLKSVFEGISETMRGWSLSGNYHSEPYIVDLLLNAGVTNTWFSYHNDTGKNLDPENGFFIDTPFPLNVEL